MSLIFEILNALSKAEGRETTMTLVKAWLDIQEGMDFLKANPGLAFGNEGALPIPKHVMTYEEEVLDGLALLAEAVANVALEEAPEQT